MEKQDFNEEHFEKSAEVFHALGNPVRLKIMDILHSHMKCNVGDLSKRLGVKQPNISQHVSILRIAKLINKKRQGKEIFYSLRDRTVVSIPLTWIHDYLLKEETNGIKDH